MIRKRVFISYRQVSDSERERVRRFGERIRTSGFDVVLDQFYLAEHPAGPSEGWPKWSGDQAIHTERVIIIGSKAWFQCFDGNQPPGEGLGAACEANHLRQRIYNDAGLNDAIRVVVFDQRDTDHISIPLSAYHHFHADRDFQAIVDWIGGGPDVTSSGALPDLTPDVEERIDRYRKYIRAGQFGDAFYQFFLRFAPEKDLNYLLDFHFNRCDLHLNLVEELFDQKVDQDPPDLNQSQCAQALNALARGYKNTGQLQKAIDTFCRQLNAEKPTGETGVRTLQNFVNTLRLAGRLREATELGHELWKLSLEKERPELIGYGLYWNGIVAATCGDSDHAELMLRQAEVAFEGIAAAKKNRGLGRTYAHLVQLEIWMGNAELAARLAAHSYNLAHTHQETREHIFTSRLRGITSLMRGEFGESRRFLEEALAGAAACGYVEEELAATIGLAELDRRAGNFSAAEDKLGEVEERAETGHYMLLLVDALNARARVLHDDKRYDEAVRDLQRAYRHAWCDGPPYAYGPGLSAAARLLRELGAQPPALAKGAAPAPGTTATNLKEHQRYMAKARWRCQFAKYLRVITGPYRYAPTKFIKLLREDWDAVRKIVVTPHEPTNDDGELVGGAQVMPRPQFVEIHVAEPCNLNCEYCRGGLRKTPSGKEKFLTYPQIEQLVNEVYEFNPKAFIRFSGLIGEPLLHPQIIKVFRLANQKSDLRWGVTTNGLRMIDKVQDSLLKAEYVHVSLDAGSDETYQRLKKGRPGDFHTVLRNIQQMVVRRGTSRTPQVIVSVLLQADNYQELMDVANQVKKLRVDALEVKMQHFHPDRHMSENEVDEAYDLIEEVQRLDDGRFRVVVVQSREQAHAKIQKPAKGITFPRCYANILGLNATVSPDGKLQTCCQYYQGTLGSQGSVIKPKSIRDIWESDGRRSFLQKSPQDKCVNCSPSDEFVNEFVDFLRKGYEVENNKQKSAPNGEDLLAWAKRQIDL